MACEINDECCSECDMMCPIDVAELNSRFMDLKDAVYDRASELEHAQSELDIFENEYYEVLR